jgi:acyl-CoA dehydrogenase
VLKRYDDEGRNEADLPLVHWGVQDALYQAEQAIDDLLKTSRTVWSRAPCAW